MTSALRSLSFIVSTIIVLHSWGIAIFADEPDVDFTQTEMKKLRELKKEPLPVLSKTRGKGSVVIQDGAAKWNNDTAVYMRVTNWCVGCTLRMDPKEEYVFVNVGP
jgi:hypothetical protein